MEFAFREIQPLFPSVKFLSFLMASTRSAPQKRSVFFNGVTWGPMKWPKRNRFHWENFTPKYQWSDFCWPLYYNWRFWAQNLRVFSS